MRKKTDHDYVGLDVLRILAMTGITLIHILATVRPQEIIELGSINGCILLFLKILSRTSVILFSMISGYFLYQKAFNLTRITKLWSVVFSSSVLLLIIYLLFGPETTSLKQFIYIFFNSLFPFLTAHYWYIFTYILLLVISPFLNQCLSALDRFHHQILCVAGGVFLCVVIELNPFIEAQTYLGNSFGIIWMSYIYCVGAYIRKYDITSKSIHRMMAVAMIFTVALYASGSFIRIHFFMKQFSESNNIVPLMMAVCFFCIFKNLKLRKNRLVQYLSSITLYVYLFQQYTPFEKPIWSTLDINRYTASPFMLLYILWQLLVLWGCGWLLSLTVKWLHLPVYQAATWVMERLQALWNRISAPRRVVDSEKQ